MQITAGERRMILQTHKPSRGGRKPAPDSDIVTARKLGMNPSTWRARLRKVRAGKMTLEEAMTLPIQSRGEIGRAGANGRWRNKPRHEGGGRSCRLP